MIEGQRANGRRRTMLAKAVADDAPGATTSLRGLLDDGGDGPPALRRPGRQQPVLPAATRPGYA